MGDVDALLESLFGKDEAALDDPYALYAAVRDAGRVHRSDALGIWVATRHEDVVSVLRDERWSAKANLSATAAAVGDGAEMVRYFTDRVLLFMDGADHARLRRLVSGAFTPRAAERLRSRMGTLVDELLDAVADDGGMDVMASFAVPLPVIVIAELLGVPPSDRGFFRAQIPRITPLLEWDVDTDRLSEAVAAIGELAGYFTGMFDARRADPRDDLVSALVLAAEDGQGLDPVELMATCVLLLGAGHETTMNLIGNGLMALLTHPTQAAIVRDDPSVARSAVDELLRFDSPVQLTGRTALEPVPLGGRTIDAGAEVVTLLGAANRDPDRWDRPDELDVTRGDAHHLAFGHGAHFCLGAALARVEGEVALPALLRRFPSLRLAGAPVRRPTVTLRGFDSLEVAW